MITLRVVFTVILFTVASLAASIMSRGVWMAAVPAHAAAMQLVHSTAISDLPQTDDSEDDVPLTPQLDVYGNEVDDAVVGYRIDPRGDEYEEHSPDTEIVRLGPPIG